MTCDFCVAGEENLCAMQEATCIGHPGGMGERVRVDSRFVFPIPDEIDSAVAAPLLCGGITVYAPLRRFGVRARSRVGVVGIGGLGHIALQMLRVMGCEVTAFSTSESKRAEAIGMGAQEFVASNDPKALIRQASRFDLILSTVHARLDWTSLVRALRPNGTLCLLGSPPGLIQIPPALLVTAQRAVAGSDIGSRAAIREMLAFSARHHITPQVETLPMSEVNAAIRRVRENAVRYRVVLAS